MTIPDIAGPAICARCCKRTQSIHTCNPTQFVRKLETENAALRKDAERYHWLKQYLIVASEDEGSWTCWLTLAQIPFRLDPNEDNAEVLLDKLIERFPLKAAPPATEPSTNQVLIHEQISSSEPSWIDSREFEDVLYEYRSKPGHLVEGVSLALQDVLEYIREHAAIDAAIAQQDKPITVAMPQANTGRHAGE